MKRSEKELNYVAQNLITNEGFDVKISADGEYFRLYFCGCPVIADSANPDLYDTESTLATFNDYLEEYITPRWIGVVKAAIEIGYSFNENENVDDILVNAEQYLIENTEADDITAEVVPEFWEHKNHLEWYDDRNICCLDVFGEIISTDYHGWNYFRLAGNKPTPAGWWESDDEDVYVFLSYAVTSDGKVKMLLA